jgi:hypothetical protein
MVATLLGYFDEQPHLIDLIQHSEVMQTPGGEFPWQQQRNETMAMVKGLFAAGAQAGEFVIHDPETASLMLLAGLRGVLRFGSTPRASDLPERIVEGFLSGYASPAGPRREERKNGHPLQPARP